MDTALRLAESLPAPRPADAGVAVLGGTTGFDSSELQAGAVAAARSLLGALLVRHLPEGPRVGRIVETEAYTADDPASHSFRGRTPRNAAMFARAGTAYVYRSYGVHWCFNVATGCEGVGEAVLVRAVEPITGFPPDARGLRLAAGPGLLTRALAIDASLNQVDLLDEDSPLQLRLAIDSRPERVVVATRIGITRAADWPRRFLLPDSPAVSRSAVRTT